VSTVAGLFFGWIMG